MKRLFVIMAIAAMALGMKAQSSASAEPVDSVMHYRIVYKWGFIQKVAAHAVVTMKVDGDTLINATLNGSSIPWDGKIFTVSDTLHASFTTGSAPLAEKVLYENAWYYKPPVGADANKFKENPANYRTMLGQGTLDADASTMEAVTITADMLGYYYIVRRLDFDSMPLGKKVTVMIDSAGHPNKRVEITYNGTTTYSNRQAYAVQFNYSFGGQMSAYPVQTVIDSATRVPLSISTDLLIGHVDMEYVAAQQ